MASRGPRAGRVYLACGFALVAAYALLALLPIAWMVSTALTPLDEVFATPTRWIPRPPRWENFTHAWTRFPFPRYFLNSLLVSSAVTVLSVVLAALGGYGLAKYRFAGREVVFVVVLASLMLPIEVLMVPAFVVVRDLGWLDSYLGLIVPPLADGFGVFVMRQFMLGLPDSTIEAARLDGAGELRIFLRIAMPLAWPAAVTLALLTWRETWDSFVWPFLVVSDDRLRTVPLGLQRFQDEYVTTYNEVMAIATIAVLPALLFFLLWQRTLIRGMAGAGVRD